MARWAMVLCVLAGFLGQLVLQGQARPGEMPRATLERLTGLHVGPSDRVASAMSMPGMDMGAAMEMPSPAGRHDDRSGGHPDDGYCPLCPLLHLPSVVLAAPFAIALVMLRLERAGYDAHPPRAPPCGVIAVLPPATGPPAPI